VVELAAAGVGALTNVIEAHRGRALLGDELGRRLHDARTGGLAFESRRLRLWHTNKCIGWT